MDILFIAPQPFYQERGTPIAIRLALTTLCEAGHRVDLLTYHEGEDVAIEGLRILRIPKPPFVSKVPIGPSWNKLVCDLYLSARIPLCLAAKHYDVIHAVEEAVFPAMLANLFARKFLIYDMDSSMADQLVERWPGLGPARPIFNRFERWAARRADLILPVCQALADRAARHAPGKSIHILPDVAFEPVSDSRDVTDLRQQLGLTGLLALYVGNLEPYQGVDLMIEALAQFDGEPRLDLVVVGGKPDHIRHYRQLAERLAVAGRAHFVGPRPLLELPHLLGQADILLSPRLKGQNTPMKIYSYLLAERAILATRIASHTQVLDWSCAMLVDPHPATFADGLKRLANDAALRQELAAAAVRLARQRYSLDAFRHRLLSAYAVPQLAAVPPHAKNA